MLALQTVLRHLIVVKQPLDPSSGAAEEVDLAPEQFLNVRFRTSGIVDHNHCAITGAEGGVEECPSGGSPAKFLTAGP